MRHRKMQYSSLTTEELIEVCSYSEDPDAWAEFVRRFHKLIASAIVRVAYTWGERTSTVIEDLVQDTYLKVCANDRRLLKKFKSKHADAFYGMLKITAGNLARDYFRKEKGKKRDPGSPLADIEAVECFVPDDQAAGEKQIEADLLLQQIDGVLQEQGKPRDREIFWLHHRHGFTAEEIAAIPSYAHLSTKGVEAALHRVKALLCRTLAPPPPQSEGISDQNSFTKGEGP
jgi:RNA polymerase sigma-70 factor (ECF subfamily)